MLVDIPAPPPVTMSVSVQVTRHVEHSPRFGMAGTGGISDANFIARRPGHDLNWWGASSKNAPIKRIVLVAEKPSCARLMKVIKDGFGRTFSHLPAIFGVSRQTLYNWLRGESPKEIQLAKLEQLASAAKVFSEQGFKVTAQALNRSLDRNLSFIELLAKGADGKSMAEKLIRLETTGQRKRQQLFELLGNAEIRDDEPDLIRNSFDEFA